MSLYNSLLLNTSTWDLALDSANNIGLQTASAAVAQDVATVLRTYQGECWFDTTVGVPYPDQVFSAPVNPTVLAPLFNSAALTVPNVVTAKTTLNTPAADRKLTGTVQVIDTTGQSLNATF